MIKLTITDGNYDIYIAVHHIIELRPTGTGGTTVLLPNGPTVVNEPPVRILELIGLNDSYG